MESRMRRCEDELATQEVWNSSSEAKLENLKTGMQRAVTAANDQVAVAQARLGAVDTGITALSYQAGLTEEMLRNLSEFTLAFKAGEERRSQWLQQTTSDVAQQGLSNETSIAVVKDAMVAIVRAGAEKVGRVDDRVGTMARQMADIRRQTYEIR
ncbi:unnamed protein product, partial [Sphacelaria rigidula]